MLEEYRAERKYHGRPIIIDLADLSNAYGRPVYEAITMYKKNGQELETVQTPTIEEGIREYSRMLEKYPESAAPLTGKYKKLAEDLRQALKAGKAAESAVTDESGRPEDGGTCNHDAVAVTLPRWNAAKVKQVAEEAGTRCFIWDLYGKRHFVFNPDTHGQANARMRNAIAVTRALKAAGYDAVDYSMMD